MAEGGPQAIANFVIYIALALSMRELEIEISAAGSSLGRL